MKTKHSIVSQTVNSAEVKIFLIPESASEKDLLVRSAKEQVDLSNSMLSDHIVFYLEKHFPNMSPLSGEFHSTPGEFSVKLKRTS